MGWGLGLETPAGSKESTEGFFETEGGISRFLRSFPASFPTVEATSVRGKNEKKKSWKVCKSDSDI